MEVPETYVMLGDGRREQTTKMFILDVLPYRARLGSKKPESVLVRLHTEWSRRPWPPPTLQSWPY